MRIKHLLFMAATALFAFTACEDPESINGNDPDNNGKDPANATNFWYSYGLAPAGIKSIESEGYSETYDAKGRLISIQAPYGSTTVTYNEQGLPTQTVSEEGQGQDKVTTTMTYEYGNTGKFCPAPMSPGNIYHIFQQGLVPNLSKVTFNNHPYYGDVVMEYKFQGNKMTLVTTGGTEFNERQERVPAEWEDVEMEYDGAYPKLLTNEHEFIGPITYQDNGMFDTYIEGFFSWDSLYPGFVTQRKTYTVSKSRQDMMLVDKLVIDWYNEGEASPYNVQTTTYTYNEHGDVTREVETNTEEYSEDYLTTYEYEYDAKGNWTKSTSTSIRTRPNDDTNPEPRVYVNERTITYY